MLHALVCMNIFSLIFWPKVRFHNKQKEEKTKTNTFIGGLNPPGSPTIPDGGTLVDAADATGEVIYTTTSPRILARQVTELQRLLKEKDRELNEYKCNRTDENTESIVTS